MTGETLRAGRFDVPSTQTDIIGVVGGVGPYSGLDLAAKIFANTLAGGDQEHLPVLVFSLPELIPDRTAFLLDPSRPDPAPPLLDILRRLYLAGARVMGIPCNTAHAAPIFDRVRAAAAELGPEARLVNMLEETALHLKQNLRPETRTAVLSTLGTYHSGVYADYFNKHELPFIDPGPEAMARVHEAIYHPEYGIKSRPLPVAPQAVEVLRKVILDLKKQGATQVVLGCTELPLALTGKVFVGLNLVDPTVILARALIAQAAPHKLRP